MRRIYLGVFLLVTAGCYAVLRHVTPMGDDLFYGRWGKLPLRGLLAKMVQHYQRANGRSLVHILDSILLGSDTRIAMMRLLIAALLGVIAMNLTRLAARSPRDAAAIAVFCSCGIFLLPPALTRQSVYWLTGAMNYVFPLAILLEYWVLLRASFAGRRGWRMTSFFALLAGLTVEQISVMSVGLTVLFACECRLLDKRKPPRIALLPFGLSLIGTLSIALAPAVSFRAGMTEPPVEGGTLAVVRYNVLRLRETFLFGDTLFPIHLLVMTAVPLWLLIHALRGRSPMDGVAAMLSAAVFAIWFWLPDSIPELLVYSREVPPYVERYGVAILAGYLLCTLYAAARAAMDEERVPLFAWILGVGSQMMMLVSPTVGPRTMLCWVGMLLLFTAVLLRDMPYLYLIGAGGILAWHWGQAWAAAAMLLALLLWQLRRYSVARLLGAAVCCVPLLFCGWTVLKADYDGYKANAAADAANRETIASYNGADAVILRKFPYELYGWAMPYHNNYYESYYKEYYGLPKKTRLIWEA